ncbi:MAG: 4Fe-4S dicluster domain-containing protein, partial [Lachnospiraceae bacterium]|nr:4Fe-4S dicluster domain-containing protein [Lachnospiraceae bacterium]
YGILCLIVLPAVLSGKRAFCHYFCWMAPFMVLGVKFHRFLRLPGLSVKGNEKAKCVSCGKCQKVCPMGIDVEGEIRDGGVRNPECILCGACIDNCPGHVPVYGMAGPSFNKEHNNGSGKKT